MVGLLTGITFEGNGSGLYLDCILLLRYINFSKFTEMYT